MAGGGGGVSLKSCSSQPSKESPLSRSSHSGATAEIFVNFSSAASQFARRLRAEKTNVPPRVRSFDSFQIYFHCFFQTRQVTAVASDRRISPPLPTRRHLTRAGVLQHAGLHLKQVALCPPPV